MWAELTWTNGDHTNELSSSARCEEVGDLQGSAVTLACRASSKKYTRNCESTSHPELSEPYCVPDITTVWILTLCMFKGRSSSWRLYRESWSVAMTAGGALETQSPIQVFENSPSIVNIKTCWYFYNTALLLVPATCFMMYPLILPW